MANPLNIPSSIFINSDFVPNSATTPLFITNTLSIDKTVSNLWAILKTITSFKCSLTIF